MYIHVHIPGTCLFSILGVGPSKTRSFPVKTKVIWVPGILYYTIGDEKLPTYMEVDGSDDFPDFTGIAI